MKTLEIKKDATVKMSAAFCLCSSPPPIHKTETINLDKNLRSIYKKA